MTRFGTPSRRARQALALAGLAALAGCVSRGLYTDTARERDALAERVRLLEASAESLDQERVVLLDEMETLRLEREQLDRDVEKLRRVEAELAQRLEQSQSELAERSREVQRLRGTYDELVHDLQAEVASGQIQIEQLREGLRLNVSQEILFASGSAELNPNGRSVLEKVASQLERLRHTVEVQGHTDDVPIASSARSRFASNWELAAARATRVVRLLAERGVDPARLRAVSFGQHHPIASNETPEGRLHNRRIEIRLEPAEGAAPEVAAEAEAPPAP